MIKRQIFYSLCYNERIQDNFKINLYLQMKKKLEKFRLCHGLGFIQKSPNLTKLIVFFGVATNSTVFKKILLKKNF